MEKEVVETYELFLDTVNNLSIGEKDKCLLIMGMADVVSVVSRQDEPMLVGANLHASTKKYAIRLAELSDNLIVKLLSSVFLEDK